MLSLDVFVVVNMGMLLNNQRIDRLLKGGLCDITCICLYYITVLSKCKVQSNYLAPDY